eukprot:3589695-Rhodomonas_salina.1
MPPKKEEQHPEEAVSGPSSNLCGLWHRQKSKEPEATATTTPATSAMDPIVKVVNQMTKEMEGAALSTTAHANKPATDPKVKPVAPTTAESSVEGSTKAGGEARPDEAVAITGTTASSVVKSSVAIPA